MAGSRIKGITIEIEGNATKLNDALKDVDKSLKDTQAQLKDVNKLLKLDPSNVELLRQKHDLLGKAVEDTKKRQEELKKALEQSKNAGDTEQARAQQDALQRELIETTQKLDGLEKEFAKSNPTLEAFSAKAQQVADKTKAISAVAGGLATALVGNAYKASQTADDLNTLSKQSGLTVEELQKMSYASDRIDVSMEDMTGSVAKLTKQMASGSDAFDTLGVAITDENGNMRDATDVWYDTLEALSQIDNETERDAIAMDLFGKSANSLAGIIDDGGEALRAYGQEAEEAGLILSGEALADANAFNDGIDKIKATFQQSMLKMGASLATTLVPALEKLVAVVTRVLEWFSNLDGQTQKMILIILALVASISPLASILAKVNTLFTTVSSAIGFLTSPIGIAIVAIGALIAVGVLLYKHWDEISAFAGKLKDNVVSAFNTLKENVTSAIENLKTSVSTAFENIKNAISEKINSAKDAVAGAIEKIKSLFNFKWELPQIKLPHFSINGSFSLNPPSVPQLSIDWYKKAYQNGIMFTHPTVLATSAGLKGFGDGNGSELVIGTDSLMGMIKGASGSNELAHISNVLDVIASNGVNVYLVGDTAKLFKAVRQENNKFKTSTGKSAFNY